MLKHLRLTLLIVLVAACIATAQSKRFNGIVHPSFPPFEFSVHLQEKQEDRPEGFVVIDHIEVRRARKLVQTIRFEDKDMPIVPEPWGDSVSLQDIDCDGYKDLLIRMTVGVHGDAWYHLYRFNKASGLFVAYPRFDDLPLKSVHCRNKSITTYVNSGAAGCMYERGTYRWANGELSPVKIESQEPTDDGSFTRVIRSWSNGKETIRKQHIAGDDCHRAN